MKYIKITVSNGFCGCDEDWYEKVDDNFDIENMDFYEYIESYSFFEPDGRFIEGKSFDDEITDDEYEEYQQNITWEVEEITKEEYEENA